MCVTCDRRAEQQRGERLPLSVRVYVKGKRDPLYFAVPSADEAALALASGRPIIGRSTGGSVMAVASDQVISVVGPKPAAVEIPGLSGKRFTIHGTTPQEAVDLLGWQSARGGSDALQTQLATLASYVTVKGEDMAESDILVMDLDRADDDLAWLNPAEPQEAVDRIVKAVRLLAEADAITTDHYENTDSRTGRRIPDMLNNVILSEDQRNAVASIEAGNDLAHAMVITDARFVAAYLTEAAFSGTVVALFHDGTKGEITAGPDLDHVNAGATQFQVDIEGVGTQDVELAQIKAVQILDD